MFIHAHDIAMAKNTALDLRGVFSSLDDTTYIFYILKLKKFTQVVIHLVDKQEGFSQKEQATCLLY